ncbi:MAG: FliA/WhiG family RNA polymerase sigma factor [Vallitaleaceae bacterium]|nr:FliA/WhiG family RNA polymerase sigma factor [Vallitaleaceae bacterium]
MDEAARNKLWEMYSKTKDHQIKDQLIVEYAPLVKFVAGRLSMYLGSNVEFDDLSGYGVFGLIDAIDKFDYSKGIKFETYASLRIRGAIIDSIRKMDWIPRSIRKKQKLMDLAMSSVESRYGNDASEQRVADELEISLDEYYKWQDQTKALSISSLEEFVEQGGDIKADRHHQERFAQPEETMIQEELRNKLIEAIEILTEKEKRVVTLYYYEELTLKEIALIMEVSESRVSQLHTKSLKKMKDIMGDYVGILNQ